MNGIRLQHWLRLFLLLTKVAPNSILTLYTNFYKHVSKNKYNFFIRFLKYKINNIIK